MNIPGEALEQASVDLVEKVLSASLLELGLDVSEDTMDLAEADMDASSPAMKEQEVNHNEVLQHLLLIYTVM